MKRNTFRRDVILVTLGITLLITGVMLYLVSVAQRNISERYIRDATRRASAEFRSMASSVEAAVNMVRSWGNSGLVSISDPDKLNRLLLPLFEKDPLLSGISVADVEGRCYFILPDGSDIREFEDYDPRTRPWFQPALETEGVYWTEQYLFHTLQQIGVTASASFHPSDEGDEMVVAFDILLTDLFRKIERLAPSENSDAFIFRTDEFLMLSETEENVSAYHSVQSHGTAVLARAHSLWESGGQTEKEVFSFVQGGTIWWCGFEPLNDSQRGDVWMGVIVPESDIIGDVGRHRAVVVGLGAGVILIFITAAVWLSRQYGAQLKSNDAPDALGSESALRDLIAAGENRTVEFKSTMRMNLHSKKPGKEIELAWLKAVSAFMNTDGGTLLLGVTDDGEITGLERDVFENEDKCRLHFKNLIANHIGAELSKYIRFVLMTIDDHTVGVVKCTRSLEPVFLKDGNKEYFYIRNGPASDELPVSKALSYIKNRK